MGKPCKKLTNFRFGLRQGLDEFTLFYFSTFWDEFSLFLLFRLLVISSFPEVESSRTSLASRTFSRTHFEVLGLGLGLEGQVLGLGLEASSPRKLACPRLEDSTIFWNVKILWSGWKIFWKTFFSGDRLKNFCEDLFFFFFFLESTCALCPWSLALASSIPVLGLESVCPRKGCPWPWPRIFFVSLALASSLVSSTPPLLISLLFRLFLSIPNQSQFIVPTFSTFPTFPNHTMSSHFQKFHFLNQQLMLSLSFNGLPFPHSFSYLSMSSHSPIYFPTFSTF